MKCFSRKRGMQMYIHCKYCGTEFNSKLGRCPNCGGSVAGNKELKEQEARDENFRTG